MASRRRSPGGRPTPEWRWCGWGRPNPSGLGCNSSRTPRGRSYLIHGLAELGAEPGLLLSRLQVEADVSARRALILALGEMAAGLAGAHRQALVGLLAQAYRDDPDSGIHGAARWTLLQLDQRSRVAEVEQGLATGHTVGDRRWYLNAQGQTFSVIPGPVQFRMGSPETEAERERGQAQDIEQQHFRNIGRSFAIATTPVTVAQFLRFRRDQFYNEEVSPGPEYPMNNVTWYDAAAYCNCGGGWSLVARGCRSADRDWSAPASRSGRRSVGGTSGFPA